VRCILYTHGVSYREGCVHSDQVPHFLLAFWYHSVNTGDKQLVRDCWPAIEKVVHYLLHDMRMEADGIPTIPGVSGLPHGYDSPVCLDPNQKICPSNWYDIVGFGGQDGLVGALAVQSMRGLAELSEWLGNETGAAQYSALYRSGVSAYNDLLWDDERGGYGDWIDTAGRRRFYLYHLSISVTQFSIFSLSVFQQYS
jgi:uncharacterized protein (DUF608 family)